MKECLTCGETIKGRKDKIYCSLKCKSAAQYEMRIKKEQFYLTVDKQLKINRKLLKRYNAAGKSTIRKKILIDEGFDPKYFTHYWKNEKGKVYLFCYEFGFLALKENGAEKYVLVQHQSYMK